MSAGSLILAEGFADAARLQDAAGFVVEVDGAGKRVGLRPPFEHDDPPPLLGEQDRQCGTHRAVAHDGDVDDVGLDEHVPSCAMRS